MEKKDLNRLSHILDAARTIQKHVETKDYSDLDNDRLFLGGVIRELLLIGEAANAVSSATKDRISLPWKELIGMRNHLIHAYFDINHQILWITATEDIPKLILELEAFLKKYTNNLL